MMIDYLILSAELSLVLLVAIACLRSAPARWRLGVALAALFVTTLPWALLPAIPIPVDDGSRRVLDVLPLMTRLGALGIESPSASVTPSGQWEFPLGTVLCWASALGLAAFAWLAIRQRSSLRRWREFARDGDYLLSQMPESVRGGCRIRILPGSDHAAASGILHPTVWIGDHHLNDERCTGVLVHELMHLHRRHPLITVALTFIRCLLWWQPFVWLWVGLARRELEYDCDEACAELLGRDRYRRTLASLVHDIVPQPGLALVGRRSVNLRRVRALENAKVLGLRHRVVALVAICMVPLLVLEFSARAQGAQGDSGATRAELVESVEAMARGAGHAGEPSEFRLHGRQSIMAVDGDLIGVYFDTTLDDALRTLANNASRPIYLHPDVAHSSRKVKVTVAGTEDEVIRAVAEHVGLSASAHPTGFVVGDDRVIVEPDWIDRAIVLSAVPNKRVRLDIDLEVDGEAIPTPVDLIVGRASWTGFEAGGCRINLVAAAIDEDEVDIELRTHFGSVGNAWSQQEGMPYGSQRTLVDGKIPGTDGKWCRVVLNATAYLVDWGEPFVADRESP